MHQRYCFEEFQLQLNLGIVAMLDIIFCLTCFHVEKSFCRVCDEDDDGSVAENAYRIACVYAKERNRRRAKTILVSESYISILFVTRKWF